MVTSKSHHSKLKYNGTKCNWKYLKYICYQCHEEIFQWLIRINVILFVIIIILADFLVRVRVRVTSSVTSILMLNQANLIFTIIMTLRMMFKPERWMCRATL